MSTLTKADLVESLSDAIGLSKRDSQDFVELFFEEIKSQLARGDNVKLSGFGNFELREKPARPGRNPKTGEGVIINERRVVTFHAGQRLKARIVENVGKE